jgi:hypothetical protein
MKIHGTTADDKMELSVKMRGDATEEEIAEMAERVRRAPQGDKRTLADMRGAPPKVEVLA